MGRREDADELDRLRSSIMVMLEMGVKALSEDQAKLLTTMYGRAQELETQLGHGESFQGFQD
jgi:hypothetical protein